MRTPWDDEPWFGLHVPRAVAGIAPELFDVRSGWRDPSRYDEQASELARRFDENFRTNPFPSSSVKKGTWYADPQFCIACKGGLVGFDTHDIAVIVLDEPVALPS